MAQTTARRKAEIAEATRRRFGAPRKLVPAPRRRPARTDDAEAEARRVKQSLDRKIRLQKKIATLARQLNGYESAARRAVAVALEDMGRRDGLKVVSASQYDELITGRTWLQEQLDTARSLMAQQDAEISRLRAAVPCSNGEDRQNFGALAEAAHEQ